jgi:hypothetical protein
MAAMTRLKFNIGPYGKNVSTGVRDCHNIISTVIKGEVLHVPKKLRYCRSYKTFDIENFNSKSGEMMIYCCQKIKVKVEFVLLTKRNPSTRGLDNE